jgi:hypothetical protein
MNRPEDRHPPTERSSPEGGYRLIPVREIAAVWFLHRAERLRFADIRAYLACHEAVARRCVIRSGKAPRFTPHEIGALTGGSMARVRTALARLEGAGVLSFSERSIEFAREGGAVDLQPTQFEQFLERFPNHDRLLPLPRRSLRLLCGGARPSLAATLVGHLVWGLYRVGQGGFRNVGRVRSSWISETFGVDEGQVAEARAQLIEMGWLIREEENQAEPNRFGAKFRINLSWKRGVPNLTVATEPRPVASGAEVPSDGLAPGELDKEPPTGTCGEQKPASGGPAGIKISETKTDREGDASGGESHNPKAAQLAAEPTLRNVVPEDLRQTNRLLELHSQAVDAGLIGPSESERLKFVAAAEHAWTVGSSNPSGLFSRLVRSKLWHYLTQDDEDAANRRLKAFLFGGPPSVNVPLAAIPGAALRGGQGAIRPGLSEDARFVRDVTNDLRKKGVPETSVWRLVNRERPDWSRERWDEARLELGRGFDERNQ